MLVEKVCLVNPQIHGCSLTGPVGFFVIFELSYAILYPFNYLNFNFESILLNKTVENN